MAFRGQGVEAIITAATFASALEGGRSARLQEQLAERDEIIVALQYVIRDLRHEIENLRAERTYGRVARLPRTS
jgi:hypothetical protein